MTLRRSPTWQRSCRQGRSAVPSPRVPRQLAIPRGLGARVCPPGVVRAGAVPGQQSEISAEGSPEDDASKKLNQTAFISSSAEGSPEDDASKRPHLTALMSSRPVRRAAPRRRRADGHPGRQYVRRPPRRAYARAAAAAAPGVPVVTAATPTQRAQTRTPRRVVKHPAVTVVTGRRRVGAASKTFHGGPLSSSPAAPLLLATRACRRRRRL